ncbi:hypothetical protein [Bradyrhizobium sp. I1.7.5]|uniref:hypothetical protein n=1 Tax=Bradyrhizobium sp. I1.7.5 TaxID=3156363 RepID=UPI003398E493
MKQSFEDFCRDPSTGLPVSDDFATDSSFGNLSGVHSRFLTPDYHFDVLTDTWSVIRNGITTFTTATKSTAQAIYDYLSDGAVDEAMDFAATNISGGQIAFDARKITAPAVSFKQSTQTLFAQIRTRLDQAFLDADPGNPNIHATFDIVGVEKDLKQYVEDNIDRTIGYPVNAALDAAERVMNGVSFVFQLDVDARDANTCSILSGAAGHHNIFAGSERLETIVCGDLGDMVYAGGRDDTVLGGAFSDVLMGGSGNDRVMEVQVMILWRAATAMMSITSTAPLTGP